MRTKSKAGTHLHQKTPAIGGSWASSLTADQIVSSTITLSEPRIRQDCLYWIERRPMEKGRHTIIEKSADGSERELTPAPFDVRNRVHEYGGGSYAVSDDHIYFCNDRDGGIYCIKKDLPARQILLASGLRFADLEFDGHGRLYCICENHRSDGEAINSIIVVDPEYPDGYQTIAEGDDFYSSPRLSPDGQQLAWISWSHPDMPWDHTKLWLAGLDNTGLPVDTRTLLDDGSSIFQPSWSPDNQLYFCSDRELGWWNIHKWNGQAAENLFPINAEFGLPRWQFGMSVYGFLSSSQILATGNHNGIWKPGIICTNTGEFQQLKTDNSQISAIHAQNNRAVMLASSPTELDAVYLFDGAKQSLSPIKKSSSLDIEKTMISLAEAVEYPTADGSISHGFFYRPANTNFELSEQEQPPLIVISHGGPTAASSNAYNTKIQYWTSRGFAVLDVNYRGSTGFGRDYRQKLNGLWGVADVEDCVYGAQYLVKQKSVDANRLIIRGSSAGGFTTLCALTFYDTFSAGASLYGIGDLETLVSDTHKFEARYLDRLVGPYPKSKKLYRQRSPINHVEQLTCPVVFFQGLEDKVVPPQQAESMVEALKQKGVMVEYITFEHEQHGFRSSEAIKKTLETELAFYGKVFAFTPAVDTLV